MKKCVSRRELIGEATLAGVAACLMGGLSRTGHAGQLTGESAWAAADIAARLGISTAVFQKVRLGARQIAAIREAGVARIELLHMASSFDYRNREQVREVLRECRRQDMAVVSVHGNLRLPYETPDAARRKKVIREALDELRFAEEAGASVFVAHLGRSDRSRRMADALLEQTEGSSVRLTVENMGGGLEKYADFVNRVGSKRFGLTVDIGHPRDADGVNPFVKEGRSQQALAACAGRVLHLHLHETFPVKAKPDHHPPLHSSGIIRWGELFAALEAIDYQGVFLFEDGRGEDPDEWVRMTAEFPARFSERYRKP